MSKDERPEALAQFAETARVGEREGVKGLTATRATEPIPTDPKAKQDAATRVLAEGATGEDLNAEEAVDALPDRILLSQEKSKELESGGEEIDQAPGRMASPASSEAVSDSAGSSEWGEAIQNPEALQALISKGFSREAALDLVAEMGTPSMGESLVEWSERITGGLPTKQRRKQILAEHHEKGLPPPEPPPLEAE
ncbi:hypothetical protein [Taklimakanibacter albus]|uniref:Uncharacterized protein n=1 Tax=Taklimakanibacter albus TaxID=2800327 RepID=A0ACC5R154_9HYPH|nr:hypothetical protein [Aestuariivirga sp. YIM B02566]MBK1866396.1 hypothetical protein [Aestuariivirga sp. YIM B02566]